MLKITSLELAFKNGKVKVTLEELSQLRKEIDSLLSQVEEKESFKDKFKKLEKEIRNLPNRIPPIWPQPFPWVEIPKIYPTYPDTTPHTTWKVPPIIWCQVGDDLSGPTSVTLSPKDVPHNL